MPDAVAEIGSPETHVRALADFPGSSRPELFPLAAEPHRVIGFDSPEIASVRRYGRFLQNDPPVGRRAENHYAYVANNPVSLTDASGAGPGIALRYDDGAGASSPDASVAINAAVSDQAKGPYTKPLELHNCMSCHGNSGNMEVARKASGYFWKHMGDAAELVGGITLLPENPAGGAYLIADGASSYAGDFNPDYDKVQKFHEAVAGEEGAKYTRPLTAILVGIGPGAASRLTRFSKVASTADDAAAANKSGTPLYRAVTDEELASIEAEGGFSSSPSKGGKYFAATEEGAKAFAESSINKGKQMTIVAVDAPADALGGAYRFQEPGIPGGTVFIPEEGLSSFSSAVGKPNIVQQRRLIEH